MIRQIAELPYAPSGADSQSVRTVFQSSAFQDLERSEREEATHADTRYRQSNIPFVDLKAQYESIKPEIDAAMAAVLKDRRSSAVLS